MPDWWLTKDGDLDCLELYERHYSCYRYADGRKRRLFVGPGEKVVLRTKRGDAMFAWRKFIDGSGQQGINCAVFRNESAIRSSDLIRQADAIADCLWPDSRHYTFVRAEAVRSRNPGFCFIAAGWNRCGKTKSGLLILERCSPIEGNEMYEPFNKETASVTDRVAWVLCQIIDDDAPIRWTRHRFFARRIANNQELMDDLAQLANRRMTHVHDRGR